MDKQYEYSGESLTTKMAQELIVELFKGKTVAKTEIVRRIDERHLERGGKTAETVVHPVTNALNALKRKDLAHNDNPGIGVWHIIDKNEPTEEGGVKRIGTGNNSVYVYYYPTYKNFAELQRKETWPCKIGRSQYPNPIHRIYEQVGTGMPEKPEISCKQIVQKNWKVRYIISWSA